MHDLPSSMQDSSVIPALSVSVESKRMSVSIAAIPTHTNSNERARNQLFERSIKDAGDGFDKTTFRFSVHF